MVHFIHDWRWKKEISVKHDDYGSTIKVYICDDFDCNKYSIKTSGSFSYHTSHIPPKAVEEAIIKAKEKAFNDKFAWYRREEKRQEWKKLANIETSTSFCSECGSKK